MKIAIIGAKGYIGKHIEHYLRQQGENTIATYDCIECDAPHYTRIDLTSVESVAKIDVNVDYIYFFAGLSGTYAGFDKSNLYVDINERGLLNLLNRIRSSEYRPKVIFPSSRLVYKGAEWPLKEDSEKETKTIYAVNKLACEGYLYAYWKSFGIPYTVFRICLPFGNFIDGDYSLWYSWIFPQNGKARQGNYPIWRWRPNSYFHPHVRYMQYCRQSFVNV